MPNEKKLDNKNARIKIYLDSCVFLALFNNETKAQYGEERVEICAPLFQEAQNKKIEIFTSELTLAECPKSKTEAEKWASDKIEAFFEHEWINVVEVDREVVLLAREIGQKTSIKPMDALQIATAQSVDGITHLFSYDKRVLSQGAAILPAVEFLKPKLFWTTIPLFS